MINSFLMHFYKSRNGWVDTQQVMSIAAIIFKMKSYLYSLDEIKWLKIS
jgi:hypothetical protein